MACRSERAIAHRKQAQHERYLRNRDEILEKQRVYRETHKEEIKQRRRKRLFERIYGKKYD